APALPLIGLLFEPSLRSRLRLASESFSLKAVQLPAADAQFQRQPGDVLTSLHPFQRRLTEIIVILPGTAHILSLLILLRFDNRHLSTPLCLLSRVSALGFTTGLPATCHHLPPTGRWTSFRSAAAR